MRWYYKWSHTDKKLIQQDKVNMLGGHWSAAAQDQHIQCTQHIWAQSRFDFGQLAEQQHLLTQGWLVCRPEDCPLSDVLQQLAGNQAATDLLAVLLHHPAVELLDCCHHETLKHACLRPGLPAGLVEA